jgi:hypothetical protein
VQRLIRSAGFRGGLMSLGALALCQPPAAPAQSPPRGEIRTVGIVGPESETLTLRARCFSRTFAFTIANSRSGPSVLVDARLDGRPARRPGAVAELRRFLAGARNVPFGSSSCVSPTEIGISLSGLSLGPARGQDDEVLRLFRIRFR